MKPYKAERSVEIRVRKDTPKITAVLAMGSKNSSPSEAKPPRNIHDSSRESTFLIVIGLLGTTSL